MKKINLFVANALFVLHLLVGIILLCGWLFPRFRILYLILLVGWPLSWILFGYCPITKWEFLLRRKYRKDIDSDNEFIQHYLYEFLDVYIPTPAIFAAGMALFLILLILSIIH